MVINSGGGSPVQSQLIASYLLAWSNSTGVPLFAFAEDCAASGGYLVACAASKIFVSSYSMVGSIGAIGVSLNLSPLLEKLGVVPVVVTSGERKGLGNPLVPASPKQLVDHQILLSDIHTQFQAWVRQQRGDRLKPSVEPEAFSGAAFSGDRAVDMGLADGTYEVLEETMASLLEKEEETLKFIWMRPSNFNSGGLLRRLLVKGEGTDVGRLNIPNTADLAFI